MISAAYLPDSAAGCLKLGCDPSRKEGIVAGLSFVVHWNKTSL